MFYLLLTLIPFRATQLEIQFHEQFVLKIYRDYYTTLLATNFRDLYVLSKVKKQTHYSMSVLFWNRHVTWRRVHRFHKKMKDLRKSVISVQGIDKLPFFP